MSLINDALRRAKDAQQQAPQAPPPDLPFRPVEPEQQNARRGLGVLLLAGLAVVALLILLFAWQWVQRPNPTRLADADGRIARVASMVPSPQPASVPKEAAAAAPVPATRPSPAAQPAPASSPVAGTVSNAPAAGVQRSEVTNAPALAPPPPPKPAPLRLQAIIFDPKRPSAIISGKTLFMGDKLGDLRVVAIDQETATLVGAGQTNILSLSD